MSKSILRSFLWLTSGAALSLLPTPSARAQDSAAAPESAAADASPEDMEPAGFDLASLWQEGGLTSDQAAARAIQTSHALVRSRAAVVLAEAGADKAWVSVLPRLDLSARYTRLSDVDQGSLGFGAVDPGAAAALDALIDTVADPAAQTLFRAFAAQTAGLSDFEFPIVLNNYALKATLTYPISDLFFSILPAYRAGRGFAEAERIRAEAEQATVALQARQAFYAYARARGAAVVAESAVGQTEAHREQVAALVDAGVAARVDLMRVDAQLATAQVGVARARGGVAIAGHALRTLLHEDGEGDVALGEDLSQTPEPIERDRQALVQQALDTRPELLALTELVRARDDLVDARAGARLPHLAVQGNVDVANPNQRVFPSTEEFRTTWDVSAILSWSPNDLAGAGADVAAARAERAEAAADLESLRDAVRLEVTQAYELYASARAALAAASAGIEAAEESYRVRQEQLGAGTAVTSDLIDAESELTRARLLLLDSVIDVRLAHARLRRALGES